MHLLLAHSSWELDCNFFFFFLSLSSNILIGEFMGETCRSTWPTVCATCDLQFNFDVPHDLTWLDFYLQRSDLDTFGTGTGTGTCTETATSRSLVFDDDLCCCWTPLIASRRYCCCRCTVTLILLLLLLSLLLPEVLPVIVAVVVVVVVVIEAALHFENRSMVTGL